MNVVEIVMFGTDGIRGQVGVEPLTSASLERLGYAIGMWAVEKYGDAPSLLLGHDTRVSAGFVKAALKLGLLRHNVRVLDAYVVPTPAVVQLLSQDSSLHAGIIISASHNPYQDNGVKLVEAAGNKISCSDEARITELFQSVSPVGYASLGADAPYINPYERYLSKIAGFFPPAFLRGKKIVLDCGHGASYILAPLVFAHLGANVIVLNNSPDGTNINRGCGALFPEALRAAVLHWHADAGFSFDGDADRVIAVSASGEVKNGDDILAILIKHPRYSTSSAVVGTIMSNQGFELHLQQQGISLLRARVGDKYVSQMMGKANLLLGGEPSGHIIVNDYLMTGDGLFVALLICETMQLMNDWSMQTFAKFPQVILNVKIGVRRDLRDPDIDAIIAQVRLRLCSGRLVVRYSGTEPLLRIMIEDRDYTRALSIGEALSEQLKERLV